MDAIEAQAVVEPFCAKTLSLDTHANTTQDNVQLWVKMGVQRPKVGDLCPIYFPISSLYLDGGKGLMLVTRLRCRLRTGTRDAGIKRGKLSKHIFSIEI